NPALRNTIPSHKCVMVGIEQHLMGLKQISTNKESPAVTQFEMGNLQLHPLTGNHRPVFTPIKLECFTRFELQGNVGVLASTFAQFQLLATPLAGKSGNAIIGTLKAKCAQIGMHLFE